MKSTILSIYTTVTVCSVAICQAAEEEVMPLVAESMSNPMDSLLTTGKIIGAFLLVAGLMAVAFKLMKRMGVGSSVSSGGLISVLETRPIAPKKYISVVQIGNQQVAVGISEQNISLLCQLDEPLTLPTNTQTTHSTFAGLLDKINSRTKKEESNA